MSRLQLPQIRNFEAPPGIEPCPSVDAAQRWNPALRAATSGDDATVIEMFDVIGEDYWTGGGVTAARVASKLKGAGNVAVNINSPGGDFFEGAAIYNLLAGHAGQVTVNVLGLAASAASIIAMAGDVINVAPMSFVMIHNTWSVGVGDRHDFAEIAATLTQFDGALRDLYAKRSGQDAAAIEAMLDDETWLNAAAAVEKGFATAILGEDAVSESASARAEAHPMAARQKADAIMAKQGLTRSQRRTLMNDIRSMPGAAPPATPSAGLTAVRDELRRMLATF